MENYMFFQSFLRSPLQVGSVIPSSRHMVEKMISPILLSKPKIIVELGAGTGVFTKELSQRCADANLIIFERDEKLRNHLHTQFPQLPIYADALTMPKVLARLGIEKVDCIVSGLPFALFSPAKTEQLMEIITTALRPGGQYVMFQYSLQMKKQLIKAFDKVSIRFTPFNFPPAFLFTCTKN